MHKSRIPPEEEKRIENDADPMRRHIENIKFMKALYGHCNAYVECMPQDKGAFNIPGTNKWLTELNLNYGTDWQIRRMKLEIVDHLMEWNVGMEFINKFKKWLFDHKFSTNE